MAAERLHLPFPPSNATSLPSFALPPVTHVYHTADPIPQGTCSGVGSPCASAGYALETRCHLGKSIVYDTVGKLGWRVDVRKHPIKEVILNVIEQVVPDGGWDWEWECEEGGGGGGGGEECGGRRRKGLPVPIARPELDCVVSTTVSALQPALIVMSSTGLLQVGVRRLQGPRREVRTVVSIAICVYIFFIVYLDIPCIILALLCVNIIQAQLRNAGILDLHSTELLTTDQPTPHVYPPDIPIVTTE